MKELNGKLDAVKENDKGEMKKPSIEDSIDGLALASALLIVGGVILWLPNYLHNEIANSIVAYFVITVGILGLSYELDKLNGDSNKLGFFDIGLGFFFVIFWIVLHYYFDNLIVNILLIVPLFMGVYGIARGIVRTIFEIFNTKGKDNITSKLFFNLINFTVALAGLYEALKKFGIIEK